ncbi:DUF4268 domain-containing protein [Pedobacter faecalis]|uniref:DUF4268 domain-containing protein n=1 Tax=Pedobacter faecalis TaxID=3041495 RepID=UPI00254C141E|nr:DUF4268 domain-containing protein [Pedobacter sp. ELA7]
MIRTDKKKANFTDKKDNRLYSKSEASQLRHEFWTTFGQYISPHPSADGMRINWVNYKTGIKHLQFKMQADNRSASIAIEISNPDPGIQELVFEQFSELKKVLHEQLGEEWEWNKFVADEYGKTICRIERSLSGVRIFRKEDWPTLISFFKPRIIALDEFWSVAQFSFEMFK